MRLNILEYYIESEYPGVVWEWKDTGEANLE